MFETPRFRIRDDEAIVVFMDYQPDLMTRIDGSDPDALRRNVLALARVAKRFNLPAILTTSAAGGPEGSLMQDLRDLLPHAPYVARSGLVAPWHDDDLVASVKASGMTQLVLAGLGAEADVGSAALSALSDGYQVFVVTDACGAFSAADRRAAWDRISSAGAQLTGWFRIAAALHPAGRPDWGVLFETLAEPEPAPRLLDGSGALWARPRPVWIPSERSRRENQPQWRTS